MTERVTHQWMLAVKLASCISHIQICIVHHCIGIDIYCISVYRRRKNYYINFQNQIRILSFFLFLQNLCFSASDLFSILGINSIVSICDCGHRPLDPEFLLSNQILILQSKKSKFRMIYKSTKNQLIRISK